MANQSEVYEFVLIGFPGLEPQFRFLVSLVLFIIYVLTLFANGTVIILIMLKEQLHQPMYILIGNLASSDLIVDTITLPKAVAMYWYRAETISFFECMFQLFFIHSLAIADSFILMLMAADRYVAICKPLRYSSIVTNKRIALLGSFFWLIALIMGLVIVAVASQLPYCGSNKVKNCFCTNTAVTSLACAGSAMSRRMTFIISMFVHVVPFSLIIFSYFIIIRTVRSSSRSENWQKALYTSTTHLLVISLYYIPRLIVYTYNQVQLIPNADVNVLLICAYTFVPHVASPIIYCLRTKEIKKTFDNIFKNNLSMRIVVISKI